MTYLLAAMMPGHSITLIIKNGILYSRLASIKSCLGTMLGTALQSGIILLGLTIIDSNSAFLKTIKILGSFYLMYLGLKILLLKESKLTESNSIFLNIDSNSIKQWGYFFEGFLVEFLNPLAFTFFVSIMTVIIKPQEFWGIKLLYWFEIVTLGFLWFFTVAFFLSSEKITFYTRKFNKILEITAGCAFILFGSQLLINNGLENLS
jgi:threonine/homoserine/homoserine lactone efflux protein